MDRAKSKTKRKDTVLFIDARHIFRQVDRAHRDFTSEQLEFIANVVRLYREENAEAEAGSSELMKHHFPKGKYENVPGLCKVSTLQEIEEEAWSLNPGRYVGVTPGQPMSDQDFKEQFEALNEELERLNAQARELELTIADNAAAILETR